jgi:hypothetical protein
LAISYVGTENGGFTDQNEVEPTVKIKDNRLVSNFATTDVTVTYNSLDDSKGTMESDLLIEGPKTMHMQFPSSGVQISGKTDPPAQYITALYKKQGAAAISKEKKGAKKLGILGVGKTTCHD